MARKHGKDRGIIEWPNRSGQWWVRLYVNGREKRYRAENKTQAKALYGRLKAEIRERTYFPEQFKQVEALTLRAWIDRCLEGVTHMRSYRNQKRYGRWWKLVLGRRLLTEVTTEEIARLQAKMIAKGTRAPQTVNRYLAGLKHVLTLAVKDGKLLRNPVCGVKFSQEPQGRLRFLSDGEITRLRQVMAPPDWVVVGFALETGLRQSEQFALRWDCINLDQGLLTIPRSKSGRTRHVPLSDGARGILQGLRSWLDSPYVFPSPKPDGAHLDGRNFMVRTYLPALTKVTIEGVTWHTLRHTFASRLVMRGVDIRTVQELMGHSTITMTIRYAHLSPAHLREAVNKATLGPLSGDFQVGTVTKTVTDEVACDVRRETEDAKDVEIPRRTKKGGGRVRTAASQFCRLLP